jgi:hypothetical protein
LNLSWRQSAHVLSLETLEDGGILNVNVSAPNRGVFCRNTNRVRFSLACMLAARGRQLITRSVRDALMPHFAQGSLCARRHRCASVPNSKLELWHPFVCIVSWQHVMVQRAVFLSMCHGPCLGRVHVLGVSLQYRCVVPHSAMGNKNTRPKRATCAFSLTLWRAGDQWTQGQLGGRCGWMDDPMMWMPGCIKRGHKDKNFLKAAQ